jgi:hypothetical protein
MRRAVLPICLLAAAAAPALAAAPEPVPEPIRLQTGCFRVTYRFLEPGHPTEAITNGKEWIVLGKKDGAHSLTHVGIFGGDPTWHLQDVWTKLPDGSWRLAVFGRGGGPPRYSCEGKFAAGRFHCKALGAPKPLRDEKRTDYDKLDRGISLFMQPKMWAQQESNEKVKNDGSLVSVEVGLIEYERLEESACAAAKKQFPQSP